MLGAFVKIVFVIGAVSLAVAYLVLLERKIASFIQDRLGPNRVGPRGLLQPIADGLKFLFKEQIIPAHVDKVPYLLAPALIMIVAMVGFAVVPFGYVLPGGGGEPIPMVIAPGVDIGLVYLFAIGGMAVYGVLLGGWASNNKYSFFGAMRSAAQLISYEIPLGLSVLGVILLSGSLRLDAIIERQVASNGHGWNIFLQPLGFLVFLMSAFAEAGRLPFDLPEAEQELVGGYHTEYSGMKFGMFALAEYTHLILASFVTVILFFGGWHLPLIAPYLAPEDVRGFLGLLFGLWLMLVFAAKVLLVILFFMWVRWSWPRFRFDQLMGLAWRGMLPVGLANVVLTVIIVETGLSLWWMLPLSAVVIASAGWIVQKPAESGVQRAESKEGSAEGNYVSV